jgi:hypothetical protein
MDDLNQNAWMTRGLYRAVERVGRTPRDRLAWLLNLVQLKSQELAERDAAELCDEIAVFVVASGRVVGGPPTHLNIDRIERDFLVQVRSRLADLAAGHNWIVRQPKLNFITSPKDGRTIEGSAPALFLWQASDLITDYREALHQCARCSSWFVAVRPFQKYCSVVCARVIHNATYQKKLRSASRRDTGNARRAVSR